VTTAGPNTQQWTAALAGKTVAVCQYLAPFAIATLSATGFTADTLHHCHPHFQWENNYLFCLSDNDDDDDEEEDGDDLICLQDRVC